MTKRYYSNTSSQASLAAAVGASDTALNFTAGSFAGYPTQFPYTAAIARGTADEEIVLVTAASGDSVTVTRAYDNTTAKAHGAGATFVEVVIALDYREANDHVNATAGVHGVTGNLVGDTDIQTLSGKTLTNPSVTDGSFTGTQTIAKANVTTLTVSGVTTLAGATITGTASITTLSVSGNGTVGGTLGVTGLLTASGGITVPTGHKVTLTDAPTAGTDAANKAYADAVGTSAATVNAVVKRDASGRAQVADPAAAADIASKNYVDTTTVRTSWPVARARQTAAITGQTAGAWVTIGYQTTDIDNVGGFSGTKFTVPAGQGGTYAVEGIVPFDTTGMATGSAGLARLSKNGTAVPVSTGPPAEVATAANNLAFATTGRQILNLVAGDYVEMQGWATVAWATRVTADMAATLTVERIR